jgi:hypothetical protein
VEHLPRRRLGEHATFTEKRRVGGANRRQRIPKL